MILIVSKFIGELIFLCNFAKEGSSPPKKSALTIGDTPSATTSSGKIYFYALLNF
jgi:hypothetical protein